VLHPSPAASKAEDETTVVSADSDKTTVLPPPSSGAPSSEAPSAKAPEDSNEPTTPLSDDPDATRRL
jgi:hypothetical protein